MSRHLFSAIAGTLALISAPLCASDDTYIVPVQYPAVEIPITYHVAQVLNPSERFVEFEDKSRWKVAEEDVYTLLSWRHGDFVIMTPNRAWFSHFPYRLTNLTNRSSICVNPLSGPLHSSPFTHHISGLDQNNIGTRAVYLDGRTCWAIHGDDFHIVDGWETGDTVIIGCNDAWLAWGYDVILLDVETNTSARARKI